MEAETNLTTIEVEDVTCQYPLLDHTNHICNSQISITKAEPEKVYTIKWNNNDSAFIVLNNPTKALGEIVVYGTKANKPDLILELAPDVQAFNVSHLSYLQNPDTHAISFMIKTPEVDSNMSFFLISDFNLGKEMIDICQ